MNDPIITLTDQLTGNPVPIYYFPDDPNHARTCSGSFGREPVCRDDHGIYLSAFRPVDRGGWELRNLEQSHLEEGVSFSKEDTQRLLDLGRTLYKLTSAATP